MIRIRLITLSLLATALAGPSSAQSVELERLMEYIEIDTINPPGNEIRGARYFAEIFDAAGIDYEIAESAPGRGNIWARLEGGDEPALVLLHHIDVVPATLSAWDSDPLVATIRDGVLYGRGTLDTKSLGIMHLEAFLSLHAGGLPLNRDVIFMATADEEAGGFYGAGWLVENRPEIFADVGYLLNEGGRGMESGGEVSFQIELAQKRPYWLRLTATDEPGHGSRPLQTSAPTRLIAALQRIQETPFEPRIVPPVREMFTRIADNVDPIWQDALADIDTAIEDPEFAARFQAAEPSLHALIRNTCSITMLTGSQKINVVPPTASAELDCRILPDQDAAEFLEGIRSRIADDQIEIEELMLFSAAASSADTSLYALLEGIIRKHFPTAGIAPGVTTGFTDSHFFRDIGIESYGYNPAVRPAATASGVHGNNERIGIETFERGVSIMIETVEEFVIDE
jgi:acetylornithine deacetylase/succinyl-diaminopimelate desuccinylase-like protein